MPDLDGKVALVTGGAGGLGAATARALKGKGVQVVVSDVDEAGGRAVAEEVGGHFVRTDVSSFEENVAAVDFVKQEYGGLDLVYLNAGIATGCGLGDDFDVALYRRAMGVNIDGVVFGAHAALPALRARGGGAMVATASLAGLTSVPYEPIYAANKHAVVGLARSLGPSLALENIFFNAVCPGFAETNIIATTREGILASGIPIIPPEKVADTVVRILSSENAGECWFVQAGREPAPFRFRGIPGPRAGEES